jgi:hypothetical protein
VPPILAGSLSLAGAHLAGELRTVGAASFCRAAWDFVPGVINTALGCLSALRCRH